ncbi:hypothetical protein SPRI_0889 [Streptomyces pristinaespiralis]|uniref:Uncharacterized protein n=1 Tax=Streptomyces pristinaespiralis TaxID=38300 RepID=A0A0M4DN76_STRPR|nr:hypothetical protein SPRI_0889 [Streptomyces pristinaespiralis]
MVPMVLPLRVSVSDVSAASAVPVAAATSVIAPTAAAAGA